MQPMARSQVRVQPHRTDNSTESESSEASEEGAAGEEAMAKTSWIVFINSVRWKMPTKKANDQAGYTKFWQIRHAYDSYVMEPHYSGDEHLRLSCRRPHFLGILGSMFLHSDIMHLLGNLLFLWVFGRALEDALGQYVYVGGVHRVRCCGDGSLSYYDDDLHAAVGCGSGAGRFGRYRRSTRFVRHALLSNAGAHLLLSGFALWIVGALWAISGYFIYRGTNPAGLVLLSAAIIAALVYFGQDWGIWNSFKVASMYAIGFWLLVSNVLPGVITLFRTEKTGGVGYWAHIGGFMCGMLYALLIGAKNEGKTEYLIEDAQKSLDKKQGGNALEYAQDLLKHQPENPTVYELLAEAYDHKNNEDAALDNYESPSTNTSRRVSATVRRAHT
jgi:membrane associated rhomboid family serine protease